MIMTTDDDIEFMQGPICGRNSGGFEVCIHDSCITIQIEAGPPCRTCGFNWNCADCKAEAEYEAWLQDRVDRLGWELALLPDEMECYDCGRHLPESMTKAGDFGFRYFMRRVTGLGPIAEAKRDPTQMYRLACGHLTM